jgi:hypothetical protein
VSCVLHAADPAILAELLANRALAGLRLRELAPTVLSSAASRADTLAALRSAGYAPVGEDASGEPLVERVARRRAVAPARQRTVRRAPARELADPAELAKALLEAPQPAQPSGTREAPEERQGNVTVVDFGRPAAPGARDTLAVVQERATGLDEDEQRLLAHAIDTGGAVRIAYVDGDGHSTVRVIEEIELAGAVIEAWCRLREDERVFSLNRIEAVAPA